MVRERHSLLPRHLIPHNPGQSVAVVHDPPQITLHSLQDGHRLVALPIAEPFSSQPCRITGVWWFREEKPTTTGSIPDIFRRGGAIVSGSSRRSPSFDFL
jgi:anaphase-promoting complex subunit 4